MLISHAIRVVKKVGVSIPFDRVDYQNGNDNGGDLIEFAAFVGDATHFIRPVPSFCSSGC